MSTSGLFISIAAFSSLSSTAQKEVFSAIGLSTISEGNGLTLELNSMPQSTSEDIPAELTLGLVRKLTEKLSEKTLVALKIIAQSNTPKFRMNDVIDATEGASSYLDMRGVWSALTRRTRKILDDSDADLIWWDEQLSTDKSENKFDWIGEVAPLTHKSLKTYFGI